jgi:hypothetical protein
VPGEQAGRVADWIGGGEEGGGHTRWLVRSGGRTSTSQSRCHRWGPSGWGGSTRRRGAWGGVEAVGDGLERAVHDSSATARTAVFGAV